jgi:hypothetical protein
MYQWLVKELNGRVLGAWGRGYSAEGMGHGALVKELRVLQRFQTLFAETIVVFNGKIIQHLS